MSDYDYTQEILYNNVYIYLEPNKLKYEFMVTCVPILKGTLRVSSLRDKERRLFHTFLAKDDKNGNILPIEDKSIIFGHIEYVTGKGIITISKEILNQTESLIIESNYSLEKL